MKRIWTALTVVLAMTCWAACGDDPLSEVERPKLTLDQFKAHDLYGKIGVPFGQCVRVRATIAKSSIGGAKSDVGKYFLDVTYVEGTPLEKPVRMKFGVHPFAEEGVQVANDESSLAELRTGQKTSGVSSEKIEEYEDGYVGKKVELLVYETGAFGGIPRGLKEASWQDHEYSFSNWLEVMEQFDP